MTRYLGIENSDDSSLSAHLTSVKEPAVFIPATFNSNLGAQANTQKFVVDHEHALVNGWFVNLFSKEGRAENKQNRAKRKRERAAEAAKEGNTSKSERLRRSADRLDMKAASLEAKAEGIKTIPPEPGQAVALWREQFPFKQRERIDGLKRLGKSKTLMLQGLGYQPIQSFVHSEYRATIYGAIEAMQLAGIAPWTEIPLDSALVTAKSTDGDYLVLEWVQKGIEGLKALGLPYKKVPRNIKDAAEYLRIEVRNNDLEQQAWACRALVLMGIASDRLSKKATITGVTGATALSVGGTIASIGGTFTVTGIGAIVGVPMLIIGGGIAAVGAVSSAVSKGAQTSLTKIDKSIEQLILIRNTAFEKQIVEAQTVEAQKAVLVQQAKSDVAMHLTKELEQIQEQKLEKTSNVLLVCAGLAVVTFVGVKVAKTTLKS